MKPVRLAALAALILTVGACGGGGGSGSSSSGPSRPAASLQYSPSSITASGVLGNSAPATTLQAYIQSNSGSYYIAGGYSTHGIAAISSAQNGGYDDITLQFKVPSDLGAGTYTDTLTIKGCYDQACTQQVTGSPAQITVTYTVTPQQPQIQTLTPSSAVAGAPALTLTVDGYSFDSTSQVLWNGSTRQTTFVSSSQLTAQITQADLATAGSASVQVATANAQSPAATFTIAPIGPLQLSRISPRSVTTATGGFYLTAIGDGFNSSSTIAWGSTQLSTTYVSNTMVRALVTPNLIATVGSVSITVINAGGTSTAQSLTISFPSVDAVSYQINPAHTGSITFHSMTLPSGAAWSQDVGGTPSYALIAQGKVFVTSSNNNANSQLTALDGATGAKLWGPLAFSGMVKAAYDAGRLFVVSGDTQHQVISALDPATGNPLWSATVQGSWFTEPPVAADGIVYATDQGLVNAFDETNGAGLWVAGFGGTSGIPAVTADGVYGASPCTAITRQPATGTTLWSYYSGCSGGGGATPVVADGVVYSPDSSASTSGVVFDAETGQVEGNYNATVIPALTSSTGFFVSNGTLQGLARSNNQMLWSFAGDGQLSTAPIVVGNDVFIGSSSGNLYALDAVTGQQLWMQNLGAAIPSTNERTLTIYTGLSAGDGLLVVPNGTRVTAYVLSTNP